MVWLLANTAFDGVSQEIDDLFSAPDEVLEEEARDSDESDPEATDQHTIATDRDPEDVADPPAIDQLTDVPIDIGALTTSPTKVTGRLATTAGASIGVNEWPWSDVADGRTTRDLVDFEAGYTMKASVTVDSRPAPYLRFQTTLSSSLNETSLRFPSPGVEKMFVDYTLADALFLRAGKFSMGWGRARLFSSPANLVSRVDDGAAIRASLPAGPGSVSGVAYTLSAWTATAGTGRWEAFAFAGQWERTMGAVSFELATHWQKYEPWQNAAAITVGLKELTLAGEVGYEMDQNNLGEPGTDGNAIGYIGNFFWETPTRSWSFWGEYSYQNEQPRVGLAMRGPSIVGTGQWRPGITWRHALNDESGQVIVGMEGTVAPHLTISLGVPLFYGKPGTTYRDISETRVNPDDDNLTEDEDDVLLISGDNVVSFGFGFSLSFSF